MLNCNGLSYPFQSLQGPCLPFFYLDGSARRESSHDVLSQERVHTEAPHGPRDRMMRHRVKSLPDVKGDNLICLALDPGCTDL
jgi:hypothetical protein